MGLRDTGLTAGGRAADGGARRPGTAPPATPGRLWLRWTLATAAAELIGYAFAAVMFSVPGGPVLAGVAEGSCLGLVQGWVLRRVLPSFSWIGWWAATAITATIGWGSMSLFSNDAGGAEPSPATFVLLAVALGIGMGLLLGVAQAVVLRAYFRDWWKWIPASAAAWGVGMVPAFWAATAPFGTPGLLQLIGLGALGGALMGGAVGVISGWMLVRMTRRPQRSQVAS